VINGRRRKVGIKGIKPTEESFTIFDISYHIARDRIAMYPTEFFFPNQLFEKYLPNL